MCKSRCCGAAARLIEEATEFALNRKIEDETLADKQAIQFMLADSVTELWAARLMTFEAAQAHDRGDDLKQLHARCSMAKLYASEMANRVVDRVLQIFGGRGYMRENVAERYFRELRVEFKRVLPIEFAPACLSCHGDCPPAEGSQCPQHNILSLKYKCSKYRCATKSNPCSREKKR